MRRKGIKQMDSACTILMIALTVVTLNEIKDNIETKSERNLLRRVQFPLLSFLNIFLTKVFMKKYDFVALVGPFTISTLSLISMAEREIFLSPH
jgi:hypothetical protein